MRGTLTDFSTAVGRATAYEAVPAGPGPHPGLLLFIDGLGMREAIYENADRFAAAGYHVVVPDLFHRIGPSIHFDPKVVFASPDGFNEVRKVLGALRTDEVMADIGSALDFLAARPGVDGKRLGAVGYCMGGRFAFLTAARYPERVRAAASIHGGNFVSAAPDSAQLEAPKVKARLYFAIAENDNSFTPDNERVVREALEAAGARFDMEHYAARHGWALSDTPVYDAAAAERHFVAAGALFAETLRA
jgi:carboxymethylenebutenolidase